jgi:hypothetical protein
MKAMKMISIYRSIVAAAALTLGGAAGARAQDAALVLAVTASETHAPIAGARVKVDGRAAARTDAQGSARVAVRAGEHRVEVSAIGRHAQTFAARLEAGETQSRAVELAPDALPLDPVTATVAPTPLRSPTLQAFYDRAANHANGRIFTREYIARRQPQQLTDLLLDNTGIAWGYNRAGHRVLRFRRAVSGLGSRDCPPKYYVNGLPFPLDVGADSSPDVYFQIEQIEGVEVYAGAPPIQYAGPGSGCGVILIWLREDAGGTIPPAPGG